MMTERDGAKLGIPIRDLIAHVQAAGETLQAELQRFDESKEIEIKTKWQTKADARELTQEKANEAADKEYRKRRHGIDTICIETPHTFTMLAALSDGVENEEFREDSGYKVRLTKLAKRLATYKFEEVDNFKYENDELGEEERLEIEKKECREHALTYELMVKGYTSAAAQIGIGKSFKIALERAEKRQKSDPGHSAK